jgi:ABC-type nitrate/sulfonate/bicarbonate transport system permease component
LRDLARRRFPPLFGIALLIGIWALVAIKSGNIPGPDKTWAAALKLFADPFYRTGRTTRASAGTCCRR